MTELRPIRQPDAQAFSWTGGSHVKMLVNGGNPALRWRADS
jgi:hypothetical protein